MVYYALSLSGLPMHGDLDVLNKHADPNNIYLVNDPALLPIVQATGYINIPASVASGAITKTTVPHNEIQLNELALLYAELSSYQTAQINSGIDYSVLINNLNLQISALIQTLHIVATSFIDRVKISDLPSIMLVTNRKLRLIDFVVTGSSATAYTSKFHGESVIISDVIHRAIDYIRGFSEMLLCSDIEVPSVVFDRVLSDGTILSDLLLSFPGSHIKISDGNVISDVSAKIAKYNTSLKELIYISDNQFKIPSHIIEAIDNITISDTSNKNISKLTNDSTVIKSNLAKGAFYTIHISDAAMLSESTERKIDPIIEEELTISDVAIAIRQRVLSLSDTVIANKLIEVHTHEEHH